MGVDGIAVEKHLHRRTAADDPRQPLRAAPAGDDTQLDLGLAEFGVTAGDADVAGQSSSQPPPKQMPLMAAITGKRAASISRVIDCAAARASVPPLTNSLMSAPAAKKRSPSPVGVGGADLGIIASLLQTVSEVRQPHRR